MPLSELMNDRTAVAPSKAPPVGVAFENLSEALTVLSETVSAMENKIGFALSPEREGKDRPAGVVPGGSGLAITLTELTDRVFAIRHRLAELIERVEL